MKRQHQALAAAAALSIFAIAGGAQAFGFGMHNKDANGDGQITREEASAARLEHFTAMDKNKDGNLDKSELGDRMKKKGGHHHGGHHRGGHAQMMLLEADTDKDGRISQAEFQTHATDHFAKMDANGDLFLDEKDRAAHEAKCASATVICGPMGRLDSNQDGKITRAEFTAAPSPHFDRVDTNKDGVISKAEQDAMRANRHSQEHAH